MRIILLGFLLINQILVFGQEKYPQDVFGSPLEIPLILAGTFGELRSNHFHGGIDIKTQQREGLAIHSIYEGTVTRIKVGLWGYGKVIYIAHPNGFTSVYGHLQKFSPEIENYVKKIQYQKKAYEIEVFPEYGELKVSKGELIAYSGNTGGSSGPHLHFEIRSSISEKPTNPLQYGYEVRDATNPTLLGLYAYPISKGSVVNNRNSKTQIKFNKQQDGSYLANKVVALGEIGFGIETYDRQDLAANKNGIFSVEQLVNGRTYSKYVFEEFSFGETRYINTLIDYEHYSKTNRRIQYCFLQPGNKLSIYKEIFEDGKITVRRGLSYEVEIVIKDWHNNTVRVKIPVEGKEPEEQVQNEDLKTAFYLTSRQPNNYDLGAAKVYFPPNTFYDNFYLDLKQGTDTIQIHKGTVPAHKRFTVTFDVKKYSLKERKKMFIAWLDAKGRPNYINTFKREGTFSVKTRNLGKYTLAIDTIPPKIRPKNFKEKQWLNNYRYLSIQISDDLSGIDTYSATLNGEWILMEYEPKTNTLTYNFDDKILNHTQCDLKLIVTDNVGNTTTFSSNFFRK